MTTGEQVAAPLPLGRFPLLDATRGLAVLLMVIYHCFFDLNWYGFTHFHFNTDPFWLIARAIILTLFLLVMGVSLSLAPPHRLPQRLIRLLGAALLVTIASAWLFPRSYIYFGVLHFAVVASGLALFFRGSWFTLVAGIGIVVVGSTAHYPLFNQPALHWVGMMTFKPHTEDYVPLIPWFGVVLLGLWLGNRLYRPGGSPPTLSLSIPWIAPLAWLGRHSLAIYLVHQPLLLGGLWLLLRVG